MSLSPWASAEAARLHHADLLAAAVEHRALRERTVSSEVRPRRHVVRPSWWPSILGRRVAGASGRAGTGALAAIALPRRA